VVEDADELLRADAKRSSGQAMARLLNLADGFIGQGLELLILLSTNEPVGRLHPATRRPGRCLADIEFKPLSEAEANAWLARRGAERRVDSPTPIADLYGGPEEAEEGRRPFGFARALAERPPRD